MIWCGVLRKKTKVGSVSLYEFEWANSIENYSLPQKEVSPGPESKDSRVWYLLLPAGEQRGHRSLNTHTHTHTHTHTYLIFLDCLRLYQFMSVRLFRFLWKWNAIQPVVLTRISQATLTKWTKHNRCESVEERIFVAKTPTTQTITSTEPTSWNKILWNNKRRLLTALWWLHFSLGVTC